MIYEKEWENPNYKFLSYDTEDLNWCLHFHESFEICFVEDGEIKITIDEKEYSLKKEDAVIIFPHQLHSYETETFSKLHIITFMPELVPSFCGDFKNMLPKDSFIGGLGKYYFSANNLYSQKGLVYSILGEFSAGRDFEEYTANRETQLLIRVLKFIENNYTGDCNLRTVARELSYEYAYVSRTFKRLMHMNYNEYLNRYRINRAVYLLSGEKQPIQDIAAACGYDSFCSFNRNFREIMGVTPRELRKRTRKASAE